jgi:hypothetical protein
MKKSQLPGTTSHKSLRDALSSIQSEMEKQHFATVNREKVKAAKAKAASIRRPG